MGSVLVGGFLGVALANAVFVDEMTMDNNDELERKIDTLTDEVRALREEITRRRTDRRRSGRRSHFRARDRLATADRGCAQPARARTRLVATLRGMLGSDASAESEEP